MVRLIRRKPKDSGLAPGTLVFTGEQRVEEVRITLIDYDEERVERREVERIEECFPFKDTPTVTWVNIDGLHRVDIIEKLGGHFGVHPLVLEDILNTTQRPKREDFPDYLFIVAKMITYNDEKLDIDTEQISLILGPTFVISFQEREGDVFDPVRDRILTAKGRIRKMGADYLAYSLLDALVDSYFVTLERLGDRVEELQEELLEEPTTELLNRVHRLKREMIELRRAVWPLREVVSTWRRTESALVAPETDVYLRDLYDHTIQVMDSVETYRDMISGMLDVYLSSISHKTNEIMKVLTLIATIFIPLTFIAGVYGMNFDFMPELEWRLGYPVVVAAMVALAVVLLIAFRRKGWI